MLFVVLELHQTHFSGHVVVVVVVVVVVLGFRSSVKVVEFVVSTPLKKNFRLRRVGGNFYLHCMQLIGAKKRRKLNTYFGRLQKPYIIAGIQLVV